MARIDVRFQPDTLIFQNLEKLKKIYNIKANTKLLEHIVELELIKHNLK